MAGRLINSYDGLMDSFKGKSLYPIYKIINDTGARWDKILSMLKKVFPEVSDSNFGAKVTSAIGAGDYMPTGEGADYNTTDVQEGYSSTVEHTEWTNSMTITQTMMEDNKTADIKRNSGLFAESYYRTREKFRAAMLAGGKTGTVTFGGKQFNANCMDSKPLFFTAHPSKLNEADTDSQQSNRFANGFDKDTFGTIVERMQNFKDDRGNIIGLTPDTIIIPNYHSLKQKVFEVIGADKDPGTSNNGFNYLFGTWNVICSPMLNPFMTDEEFIIMDSYFNEQSGAQFFNRINNEISTDYSPDRKRNLEVYGRARWSALFHDWRAFAIGGVADGTALT